MTLKRVALAICALVVVAILLGVGWLSYAAHSPLPDHESELQFAALSAPVQITRTDDGVPHIYAETKADLLFAQGYVHAQDRWWTMEFYRHVARGELSALVGKDAEAFENDTLMRLLGFADLAEGDYAALDTESRALIGSFAAGVNAYIDGQHPNDLAVEYALLKAGGVEPVVREWSPTDSLAVARLLGFSLSAKDIDRELARAALKAQVTPEMYAEWAVPYDYARHPTVLKAGDLGLKAAPPLSSASQLPTARTPPVGSVSRLLRNRYFAALPGRADGHGSNAWVVSGAHTASGSPMIAVDPHQGLELPNVYHEIGLHLRPPSGEPFDIYGFAAAPFFLILEGMNTAGAWATTNVSGGDSLDLYRLQINPADPDQYRWNGAWRTMESAAVSIAVGDGSRESVRLRRTHFGPVLPAEPREPVYAARWGGFARSAVTRASLRLSFATNFDEFRSALADWDYPPTNFLWAARSGEIGFQTAGRFPIRPPGADATVPQDGSGSATEWRGFLAYDAMPTMRNPASGIIVTGNNMPVPPGYFERVAASLPDGGDPNFIRDASRGYRGARIERLLSQSDAHDEASFRRIQLDVTVEGLAASLRFLAAEPYTDQSCARAIAGWKGDFAVESTGAAAFARLWSAVLSEVYQPHAPETKFGVGMTQLLSLQTILANTESGWWDDPRTEAQERRDDRLPALLEGPCNDATAWGDLHRAVFTHPLFSASGIPLLEGWGSLDPISVPGGVATVNMGRWNEASGDYTAKHIAAYRFIHDLATRDALAINSTGQSSHPASSFYASQTQGWASGTYRRVELNPTKASSRQSGERP